MKADAAVGLACLLIFVPCGEDSICFNKTNVYFHGMSDLRSLESVYCLDYSALFPAGGSSIVNKPEIAPL